MDQPSNVLWSSRDSSFLGWRTKWRRGSWVGWVGGWKHSAINLLGSWWCLPLTRAFQLPHQVHVCGRRGEERGGETHLPSQACPQTATAFHLPHQRWWAAWTTALIVTLTVIITTVPSMMTTMTVTTMMMMMTIMMTRTAVTAIQTVHRHKRVIRIVAVSALKLTPSSQTLPVPALSLAIVLWHCYSPGQWNWPLTVSQRALPALRRVRVRGHGVASLVGTISRLNRGSVFMLCVDLRRTKKWSEFFTDVRLSAIASSESHFCTAWLCRFIINLSAHLLKVTRNKKNLLTGHNFQATYI